MLPNMIVAVGGAGKKLVFSLLDKEWVLEEFLKPSTRPLSCSVWIVDTARDEIGEDEKKIADIQDKISRIQGKFRENTRSNEFPGTITIKNIPITGLLPLTSAADICGEEVKRDVARATDIKKWWFDLDCYSEETRRTINEQENFRGINFATGVVRRRALGKALFFKALSEDILPLSERPSPAKVAMVVGLGGGTGSGMFIDLAKRLREGGSCDVVLFGILPTTREWSEERANGYAALCELERLTLDEGLRGLFADIILVPLEPTGYKGHIGPEDSETELLLKEFSEAFPYTFISYYKRGGDRDLLSGSRGGRERHTPFIIASSCVLRYDVETRRKIAESYAEALKRRKNALEICQEINHEVDRFLGEHGFDSGELVEDDVTLVEERLKHFKKWLLESDFFSELGYTSFKEFVGALENAEGALEDGDMEEKVELIEEQMNLAYQGLGESKDEIEELFREVVLGEIREISSLLNLLKRTGEVADYDVKRIVKQMIRKDKGKAGDSLLIGRKLKELNSELISSRKKRDKLEKELKELEEETEERVKEFERRIKRLTEEEFLHLAELESERFRTKLERYLRNLQEELDRFAELRSRRPRSRGSSGMLDRSLSEFSRTVENIDEDFDEVRGRIERSLELLGEYMRVWRTASRKPKLLSRLIGKFIEPPDERRAKQARMTAEKIADEISSLGVFGVEEGRVWVIFDYPLEEKLEEHRNMLINEVVKKVEVEVSKSFGTELDEHILKEIERSIAVGRFERVLEKIVRVATSYERKKKRLEEELEETKKKIEILENEKDVLASVDELYKNLAIKIKKYIKTNSEYEKKMEEFSNLVGGHIQRGEIQEEKHIVVEIPPEDRRASVGRESIAELMTARPGEREHLTLEIRRVVENKLIQSEKFCGLVRRRFENVKGDRTWTVKQVALYITSIANSGENALQLPGNFSFQDYFGLRREDTGIASLNAGDRWDVGLTLFIGGVMLDNVAFVAKPVKGFYKGYEERVKLLKGAAFLHHSYALENGSYFVRKPVSLETKEREMFFGKKGEVEEKIKGLYEEKSWLERGCHEAGEA